MSGRARDGRLVHFTPTGPAVDRGDGASGEHTDGRSSTIEGAVRPGDVVTVRATYGAPHHVVADGDVLTHRRTRAGDAHGAGQRPTTPRTTGLGLPTLGPPAGSAAAAPAAGGCSTLTEVRA
jgi:tRNA-2-methylthio-N6-dimethylallyladenosine synthase